MFIKKIHTIKHKLYRKMHPMSYKMIVDESQLPDAEDGDVVFGEELIEKAFDLKDSGKLSFSVRYVSEPEVLFVTKVKLGTRTNNGYVFTRKNFEPFLGNNSYSVVGEPDEENRSNFMGFCKISDLTDDCVTFTGSISGRFRDDCIGKYIVPCGFGNLVDNLVEVEMDGYELDVLMLSKTQSGIITTTYEDSKMKPIKRGLFKRDFCNNCGEPLDKNSEKCDFCGQYIDWS